MQVRAEATVSQGILRISFLFRKSHFFAPRSQDNSARLPSRPTESRRRLSNDSKSDLTKKTTRGQNSTNDLTKTEQEGEEDADNNEEALVSHHGVQTVLACSSQHISDYLLPIYATLINVIHKANIDLDL